MFERYTERARRVVFFARYEAAQLRSTTIDSGHLLLGLLRERSGFAGRALAHVSSDEIRQEIRARGGDQTGPGESVEIPFTDDAKRALQHAADEAERLVPGASQDRPVRLVGFVGAEHLLLGLLREPASAALLEPRGLQLDEVRASLARSSQEPVVFAVEEDPASALLTFVPYDAALHREFADMLRNTPLARHAGHCAVLTNASTRRIVSVVAQWTADPAGAARSQYVRRDSYFTDPGSRSIEPGVTVLATPMGFSEAITGPRAMVWATGSSHLEDAGSIAVALDSVVFEDGQIVGADESGIEGYIQEKRAAVMALLQLITEAEAAGEDVRAVLASIADSRPDGRPWRRMFARAAMHSPSAWAERMRALPELPRFWR